MKREDVIGAIETLRKYNSETNRIEAKTHLVVSLKNVMILFQVSLINMGE